jgi:hypothetical protein
MTTERLNNFGTREDWLNFLAAGLASAFRERGAPLPDRIRIAIGFPSTGRRGKRIGECWDSTASQDGTFEIMIRPDIDEACQAAAILAHELCHAAAVSSGWPSLSAWRARCARPSRGRLSSRSLSPYSLLPGLAACASRFNGLTTRPKKQSTRLLKCECLTCGYVARVAWKWLEDKGAPHCPEHVEMVVP